MEYGLIVSLICLAILTAVSAFGEKTTALIDYIGEQIDLSI